MGEEHDSWVKSILGFDAAAASAGAGNTVADPAMPQPGNAVVQGLENAGHTVVHGLGIAGHAVVHGLETAGHAVAEKVKETVSSDYANTKKATELTDEFEAQMKRVEAQIKRLSDAAIDSTRYSAQAKDLRSRHDTATKEPDLDKRVDALTKLVAAAKDAADRATADTDRGTTSAVEGIDKAVIDMRDTAKQLIDKLDAKNDKKPELGKRLGELSKEIDDEAKMTDRAARSKALKRIEKDCEALLDDASAAAKDPAALQATYKKALEDRYGFKVDEKAGISSHNDQVYKMFDKVPDTDLTQDKLKKVEYSDKMPNGTSNPSAYYYSAGITMGAYSDTSTLPYQDPTTKQAEAPNAFSISTLHELGHSVDDRFGLMRSSGGKAGAGGWQDETVDKVAQAYINRFTAGPGKAVKIDAAVLNASVRTALGGGTATKPPGVSDPDWAAVKTLLDGCAGRLSGKSPWDKQDDIGGRSYHHSGNGWVSYSTASRGQALSVSNYQWRSPAEFFAELYAWTYYNSKPPPNAVESSLIAYMYGGASASPPAGSH